MVINSSLLQAMHEKIASLAVIILDESDKNTFQKDPDDPNEPNDPFRFNLFPAIDTIARQQKVIMLAQAYNCPIFLVQFEFMYPAATYYCNNIRGLFKSTTQISLRSLIPMETAIINKHSYNAFHGTNLERLLNSQYNGAGVNNLVVMGGHSNVCVPATIGPQAIVSSLVYLGRPSAIGAGAVDLNFTVLTSQKVLNGDAVEWSKASPQIKFYKQF